MRLGIERIVARVSLAIMAVLSALACSAPERLPAVPLALQYEASIPGMPDVRFYPSDPSLFLREASQALERERAHLGAQGQDGPLPPAAFLAISGGGDKGAFGAGLLNGWTAAGDRPVFKMVTGISTGALIAPFAFLGPAYDAKLKALYTDVVPRDILEKRNIVLAVLGDAMADNRPLWQQLERHITREMLDEIAAEYQKGRLLFVGTTNLDARLAVYWNMTKIAASQDPRALELFRQVMIASAAIPAGFPPSMIDVEAGGRRYQEMHVDGGTSSQVFVYPVTFKLGEEAAARGVERARSLYIIRNARLDVDWASVERKTLSIAGRAISNLITTQGIGDLFRIYATAQRDSVEFNLAYVPSTFNALHKEDFDQEYMRALYQEAYGLASKGYPWQRLPPGFTDSQ